MIESSNDYGTITSNLSINSNSSNNSQNSTVNKLDLELHCTSCNRYYQSPVILPCGHYLCSSCAVSTLVNSDEPSVIQAMHLLNKDQGSPTIGSNSSGESDRISVVSETDSGVVFCSPGPRSNGRISILSTNSNESSISYGCFCPTCNKVVALLDDGGVDNFPRNYGLERIIQRVLDTSISQTHCQLCEESKVKAAVWCENCDIFYCEDCRIKCHPSRGPLVKHVLLDAPEALTILKKRKLENSLNCSVHREVKCLNFCLTCRQVICQEYLSDNKDASVHLKHNIQTIVTAYKNKKIDLSQSLKGLSEKAKNASSLIHNLKTQEDDLEKEYQKVEKEIKASIDELIKQLEDKKKDLCQTLETEREKKQTFIKDFTAANTQNIAKSSRIIQFCIEMMKECDPVCFLQNFQSLNEKIASGQFQFSKDQTCSYNLCSPETNSKQNSYQINGKHDNLPVATSLPGLTKREFASVKSSIRKLRLSDQTTADNQSETDNNANKSINSPSISRKCPTFIPEQCLSEGNTITLVWKMSKLDEEQVVNYVLELDDGINGLFRKVYKGKESICTVEGLHFRSIYRARVKAIFSNFQSLYSPPLKIQTSNFTWFNLDVDKSEADVKVSNSNMTISGQIFEHQVILGSTGLSRGIHYWQFTINKYESSAQPAFGIAKADCNKNMMLGRDEKSWSMYIDGKRSWFLHKGEHFERTDGGISPQSVIGVRLDCDRGNLSYYLNDEPHGPIAFTELPQGVYYPAVSISKGVQVTLNCGLEPPSESEESDESHSDPEVELRKIKETLNIL